MGKNTAIITKFRYRASKFWPWGFLPLVRVGMAKLDDEFKQKILAKLKTHFVLRFMARINFVLLFLVLALSLEACSDLKFQTRHQDLPMVDQVGLSDRIQVEGQATFYFFGLYPTSQTIWVDQELIKRSNLKHLSAIQIKTYRTWPDWLTALFTLGIYVPVHYQIAAKGVDYDEYH